MTEQLRPIQRTPVRPIDVYLAIRNAWFEQLGERPSRASLLVLLAQWHLETDGGARCMNYNLGGIKHVPGDGHDYAEYLTREVINGQSRMLYQQFRAYGSLDESAPDYVKLQRTRFAKAWVAVLAGDVDAFAELLKEEDYYTAAEKDYDVGLRGRYKLLDGLLGPDTQPELPVEPPDRSSTLNDEAQAVADESPDPPEAA